MAGSIHLHSKAMTTNGHDIYISVGVAQVCGVKALFCVICLVSTQVDLQGSADSSGLGAICDRISDCLIGGSQNNNWKAASRCVTSVKY